jgi:hypothetical protein
MRDLAMLGLGGAAGATVGGGTALLIAVGVVVVLALK